MSATAAAAVRERVWAVLDVEKPGSTASLRGEAQSLVAGAMVAAGIPEVAVVPGSAPHRVVLAFPAGVTVRDVGDSFPATLWTALRARNEGRDPHDRMRVTVAFDRVTGDRPSDLALRIADAPVLARVRAQTWDAEFVVAASESWCDWDRSTEGFSHVRSGSDRFWIGVPGRLAPLGLRPGDIVSQPDATLRDGHFRDFPGSWS